jgi:2-keto-4-pentenoate hydratase/2-oxohepta-3-ene-1,7-dioic acid hydratase in catechol pathway
MKLVRFSQDGKAPSLGVCNGAAIAALPDSWGASGDMIALIENWPKYKDAVAGISEYPIPLDRVLLHAPIAKPPKILGIGLNYAEHAAEGGAALPTEQMWFSKPATTVNGPYSDIQRPLVSEHLDYEVELVFIIGRRCRHVSVDTAMEFIFGYCVGNDVSVRDWQLKTSQVFLGKAFDGHAPFGPWITSSDSFDPADVALSCSVNGELRQSSRTGQMVFDCAAQVALLSQVMTLEPGDIVFTGTPSGVGALMTPPMWLKPGDVVRSEIEGLGYIENRVVAEMPVA